MKKQVLLVIIWLLAWQPVYAEREPVRIAVIDTGLADELFEEDQILPGINYMDPEAGTQDRLGHGTGVASLILGLDDPYIGGAAPDASLIPLVVASKSDAGKWLFGDSLVLAQAIYDAIDLYDCRIINISLGTTSTSQDLQSAVAYAEEKGVVIISSVGNSNRYAPERVYYPAAYQTVIGVSALMRKGSVAAFAQRNESVFICAPGDRLKLASMTKGKSTFGSGTSYATAYVTSAAAQLLQANPELSPEETRNLLRGSAADLGQEGYDKESGWGALNMEGALLALTD